MEAARSRRDARGQFQRADLFIEPIETIEQNNELQRLLEEEQEEEHRILAAMTRQVGEHAEAIRACATILAEVESLFARAQICGGFSMHGASFFGEGIGANFSESGAPSAAGKTTAWRSVVATIVAQRTSIRTEEQLCRWTWSYPPPHRN